MLFSTSHTTSVVDGKEIRLVGSPDIKLSFKSQLLPIISKNLRLQTMCVPKCAPEAFYSSKLHALSFKSYSIVAASGMN